MFSKRILGLIVVFVLLTACSSQSAIRHLIVGKWFCPKQWNERDDHIQEFTGDGQVTVWGDGIAGDGKHGAYQFLDDSHLQTDFPASQYGPRLVQAGRVDITEDTLTEWSEDGNFSYPCHRIK